MKVSLALAILSGSNLVFAFLIQAYVFVVVGPGEETDALFAGLALPQLVMVAIGSSLTNVLVPLFTERQGSALRRDAWSLLAGIAAIFGLLACALYFLAPLWVRLIVPGFSAAATAQTLVLARILLIAVFLHPVSAILWALHHASRRFYRPEIALLATTLLALAALVWILPRHGVVGAAWVHASRLVLMTLLLSPALGAVEKPDLRGSALRALRRRMTPLLIVQTYTRLGPVIDRVLSSLTPAGGLSLLYFANQIHHGAHALLTRSITAPMLPALADHAQRKEWKQYRRLHLSRLIWVGGLPLLAMVLLLAVGPPLLRIFVGHGSVTESNVRELWLLCIALGGVLIATPVEQNLAAAFFARGNTAIPSLVGIAGFTVAVGLRVIGYLKLGLIGIALAASVNPLLNCAAFSVLLWRQKKGDL